MLSRFRRSSRALVVSLTSLRLFRALAVLGLFLSGHALVVSGSTFPNNSCAALKQWAEEFRNTSPTLDRVRALDRAHRIALLNVLTPETQAALWREHLGQFSARPGLSETQRAYIAEGIELTTPALYRHDPAAKRALDDFWLRAKPAFGMRAQALPWFDLSSYAQKREAGEDWCECTTDATEIWCPGSCYTTTCKAAGGCGLNGQSPCDGMCQ
jgi:hypothetical protein